MPLYRKCRTMLHRLSYWLMTLLARDPAVPATPGIPIEKMPETPGVPIEETEGGKLWQVVVIEGRCPECEEHGFLEGPHGGISVNVYCKNRLCRAGFNVTPLFGKYGIVEPIGTKGPIEKYPAIMLH